MKDNGKKKGSASRATTDEDNLNNTHTHRQQTIILIYI